MAGQVLEDEFTRATDPYRRELLAHCYRMLGSVHDAEDLVQETYLRAWRAYDDFEGRSSMRTWLYRIATNTCLNALESKQRRPLPTGLGGPSDAPEGDLAERQEVSWLEPVPDAMVAGDSSDPATLVAERESVRLAFIAALQYLPPRQRAVLILRDVLRWRAAEVADAVGISTAAVNSTLQRARAQLDQAMPEQDQVAEPTEADKLELLERWVKAFESYDVDEIVRLFTEDVVWEMPPFAAWFKGALNVGKLIATQCPAEHAGDQVLVPVSANGQPGFALYMRDPETRQHRAFQIQVLTLTAAGVAHAVAFFDVSLFEAFGLPQLLSDLADSRPPHLFGDVASSGGL
ncbi:MAG TPA: sigma-70 family RNA polymerase sigma factor [Kribbellaceae bacterium]|nr:sigma-70 family RNA polymerase sigma factor [Kribbellaceae bacterium]